ncbi:tRNA pseudouridine(38-40) synthase TruA [Flavobacteriaceae bacterium]|jgi:tRNA pseudouridine38-40 synthase|nr:tRNA pseudouridine(38-40) synthase TruA [Flavobacteriaceae bacterium]
MFTKKFYYLIDIQYLGYRFHGWQKQPNLKTVQLMIERTLKFILDKRVFKILAAGRTDAMVSANKTAFELFLNDIPIKDFEEFLRTFNFNLPQDIRALSIQEVDQDFNIIQHPKVKEYLYLFTEGKKNHPFCAPMITTILEPLNIELMQRGARLFEGVHNFKSYCYKPSKEGLFIREIVHCSLKENNLYTANFFPKTSYLLTVKGEGFGRNQIRLMMGVLICLGRGDITLDFIKESLEPNSSTILNYIAPASGLILNNIEFKNL